MRPKRQESVRTVENVPLVTRCFTFGFGHAYPNGFVRITASTAAECRAEMYRRYGAKWAFEYSEDQIADQLKRFPQMYEVGAQQCKGCQETGMHPSHDGSQFCKSGSIASGGDKAHCTCDWCF